MNPESFSKNLAHPVTVISVSDGNHENIATMSWVCALSQKPPLLMVAISPLRYSHDLVLSAGEFAIMVLAENQKEQSTLAGTISGKNQNKWELSPFRDHKKAGEYIKAPVLAGCNAVFECRLINHLTTGDHTLFVGEVVHYSADSQVNPLILFNRQYFKLGQFLEQYP
jgi:flavin reductase (DIM6/NTAB) family NADH-FMN oxidoreductase RutF